MPRFILIEPAIEGWTGHYYEYAARVLRAAKEAGYEPILAINRAFQGNDSRDIRYMPVYRLGQRLVPKNFPLYYLARKLKNKIKSRLSARKEILFETAEAAAQPAITKETPLRWLMKQTFGRYKIACFTRDTVALFQQITLTKDDIVFFPTASEYELHGLMSFFDQYPHFIQAKWHFLFHSNIVTTELHAAFIDLLKRLSGNNLYFYTDTEQLTAQYNQLGLLHFDTLPIPIELGGEKAETYSGPLCVSYIGDARAEKGYQHLPQVVKSLWQDYVDTQKIRFVIQSNFNIEEGEPAAIIARAKLDAFSEPGVTLLKQPLDPMAYRDLLFESDIVLFPYDRVAYAARSSGIFTEALVAGIPVVVPEGSWMALQLRAAIQAFQAAAGEPSADRPQSVVGMVYNNPESISQCVGEIVRHYAHYRESAKAFSKTWSAYHNPTKLLECLFQAAPFVHRVET